MINRRSLLVGTSLALIASRAHAISQGQRLSIILGGANPANAILDENGQPVRDENNQLILAGP